MIEYRFKENSHEYLILTRLWNEICWEYWELNAPLSDKSVDERINDIDAVLMSRHNAKVMFLDTEIVISVKDESDLVFLFLSNK